MNHITTNSTTIGGRACEIFQYGDKPQYLLIQPVDEHDLEDMEAEVRELQTSTATGTATSTDEITGTAAGTNNAFLLAAFKINDWDNELTPWPAEPVFGKTPFGDGAPDTLRYVTEELLPALKAQYFADMTEDEWRKVHIFLGGYSLAGFFALWSAYQTDIFDGICAASPSVWYPKWMEYAKNHKVRVGKIYLSLGDREERTKNAVMATVGDHIRELDELFKVDSDVDSVLEWNKGNHFKDSGLRTAKGFTWLIDKR